MSTGLVEILAQFGAASAFAGVLAVMLWRVIQAGQKERDDLANRYKEERADLYKALREDNERSVDAMNGLRDVLIEMRTTMRLSNKTD